MAARWVIVAGATAAGLAALVARRLARLRDELGPLTAVWDLDHTLILS